MSEVLLRLALTNAGLAALLAVPAALASVCLRGRPALAHGLWLLVLLKLVTPPLVRVPMGWPAQEPDLAPVITEAPPPEPTCPAQLREEPEPVAVAPVAPPAAEPEAPWDWRAPLVLTWLGGAVVVWAVAWERLARLGRVLGRVPEASEDIRERVTALCARLGLRRAPRAWLVPGVVPPMLLALGRPRLLVPAGLWGRLGEAQRDALLLHELAHLRRGDHLVRWLELLALGLFWWYPLAWWASRALRDAEEHCCDAWVVWADPEGAPAYADALVETVAFLSGAPASLPLGASGAGPVRSLTRRLSMILRRPPARRLSPPALAALVLVGAALLPLMPVVAQTPRPAPWPTPAPRPIEQAILNSPSCRACHDAATGRIDQKKADGSATKLHDEIVGLMKDLTKLKATVEKTEKTLKEKLDQFEAATGTRPGADRRIDDLEKKLELLLRELRELKGARRPAGNGKSTPSPNSPTATFINKRVLTIPVRIEEKAKGRMAVLYVSTDGGKTYRAVERGWERDRFSYTAPADGVYGFHVEAEALNATRPPAVGGTPPTLVVHVDTRAPNVEVSARAAEGKLAVGWKIEEENLDMQSLALDYRVAGSDEWTPVTPLSKRKSGFEHFKPDGKVTAVRMRAADLAGNSKEATVTLDPNTGLPTRVGGS
jgi:beta-lactamase regulating signal transducer with metallopeptidase domain